MLDMGMMIKTFLTICLSGLFIMPISIYAFADVSLTVDGREVNDIFPGEASGNTSYAVTSSGNIAVTAGNGSANQVSDADDATSTIRSSGSGDIRFVSGTNSTYNNFDVQADGGLYIEEGSTVTNSTFNVQVGSDQQVTTMISELEDQTSLLETQNTLLTTISNNISPTIINVMNGIRNFTLRIEYHLSHSNLAQTTSSDPVYVTYNGVGINIYRFPINYTYLSYTYGSAPEMVTENWRGTFADLLNSFSVNITKSAFAIFRYLVRGGSYAMYSVVGDTGGQSYTLQVTNQEYATIADVLVNRLNTLVQILNYIAQRFFNWYYPLDDTNPLYWRYYNTDTQQSENIGLAGLMYNISWYLGQMYSLQAENSTLTQLSNKVDEVNASMESMEQSEHAVFESVSQSIENFIPSLDDFTPLNALGWCSNYLQQIYVSLGTYGFVILTGLVLSVCLQFIGYFRYK